MSDMFGSLVGKNVRMERGGPGSSAGKLLAVGEDFAVLHNKDEGIIYFAIDHLKSITVDLKDNSDLMVRYAEQEVMPLYVGSGNMNDVMNTMMYRWVQMNRAGHEAVRGVLTAVGADYVDIVNQNELIRIMTGHIKSFSYVGAAGNQQQDNGQNSDQKNKKSNKKKGK